MTKSEISDLEKKIVQEIPILKSFGVRLLKIEGNRSVITVPLLPNHNHKGTAFGGSLYAACTAACYSLLYSLQLQAKLLNRDLVIASGQIQYAKPVEGDFIVVAEVEAQDMDQLLQAFSQNRTKRLVVKAFVRNSEGDENLCVFEGEFAFIKAK